MPQNLRLKKCLILSVLISIHSISWMGDVYECLCTYMYLWK